MDQLCYKRHYAESDERHVSLSGKAANDYYQHNHVQGSVAAGRGCGGMKGASDA